MNFFPKHILILFFSFFFISLNSQTISVIDENSGDGIPNVLLYNSDKSKRAITNLDGLVSLDDFIQNDIITFSHISYEEKSIILSELVARKKIFLLEKSYNLTGVVLSVSRNSQDVKSISRKVSVIDASSLRLEAPKTTADLLYQAGGVHIQKTQAGGGSPVVRGFEANRVLLVIDGVRMNNAIYRSGHLQNSITVDQNSLERTELIFGPSSVAYGSDALGGVIHFYTKTPKFSDSFSLNYSRAYSYNISDKSNIRSRNIEISNKKWASFTSFTRSFYGDVIMGENRRHGFKDWGLVKYYSRNSVSKYFENASVNSNTSVQKNTAYKQKDFLQKFNFKTSENSNLILNFQFSESSNISRFDKLSEINEDNNLKYAQWYYGPQKRLLSSINYNLTTKSLFDKGSIILSHQYINESRNSRKFNSLELRSQEEKLHIFSVNADFSKNIGQKNFISYGIETTKNNLESIGNNYILSVSNNDIVDRLKSPGISRYPDNGSTYNSIAGYFNIKRMISEKTYLNAGSRFSRIFVEAGWNSISNDGSLNLNEFFNQFEDFKLVNSSLTYTLGLSHQINNFNKFSLNISKGFRAPNIDDIGKIRENGGILTVPNSSLKPEKAISIDFGLSKYDRKFNYSFNLFYTRLNETIGRNIFYDFEEKSTENPATVIYDGDEVLTMSNFNLGKSDIYGFNFDFTQLITKEFKFTGSLSFTEGDIKDKGLSLPSIPPLFGNFKLNFTKSIYQLQLSYKFSRSKDPNEYSLGGEDSIEETPILSIDENGNPIYGGMPKWGIFQLSSLVKINSKTYLQVLLDNIFDIHYREFASGISSPGRSLNLKLTLN